MNREITITMFCSEMVCPICLEFFRAPVMLPCGHNFCHDCIMKYWRVFVLKYICPQCKVASETEAVVPNRSLERFARLLEEQEAGGKEACEEHQAPWKYFCKNHQAPLCEECAESSDHEGHVKISLEQATYEFKAYFREFLDYIENQKSAILQHKTSIDKESQDVIAVTETLKEEMDNMFEELRHFLNREEHTQISKIREVRKNVGQKREERMDEFFWQLSYRDKMIRELQKKCAQQANDLLQDISSTLERCTKREILQPVKLFPPKNQWEVWNLWDVNIFLKSAFKQFQESVKVGLALQQAEITFDQETAHPLLVLSMDCKSVALGNKAQSFPKSHKRFDTSLSVLGCEEFKEGRNYWDVSMGPEGEWSVGVARKSLKRKNTNAMDPKSGIWAIGKRGSNYFAFNTPNGCQLQISGQLRRIRIFLNCTGRQVTFFDADEARMLYRTFTNTVSREVFVPFFHLSRKAELTLAP